MTGSASAATAPDAIDGAALRLACEAVAGAANQCDVVLQSEQDLAAEAELFIARIDGEMERMQRAGELKSVNKSYQTYRLEASRRGERVQPYQHWMAAYREKLVRQLASTLRYF